MLRDRKGFTLIELLIVIAIIGILAAIAIPAFLGQRGKAKVRVMEAAAKSMERELRMVMDHYNQKTPLVFSTTPGALGCFEYISAGKNEKCDVIYPDVAASGTYKDVSDIISLYVQQQNVGLQSKSPYDGMALMTEDETPSSRDGHIFITNTSDSNIDISAWNESGARLLALRVSAF